VAAASLRRDEKWRRKAAATKAKRNPRTQVQHRYLGHPAPGPGSGTVVLSTFNFQLVTCRVPVRLFTHWLGGCDGRRGHMRAVVIEQA
jgi:hypothetical protein